MMSPQMIEWNKPRAQTRSTRSCRIASIGLSACLLLVMALPRPILAITPLERDLKKIERYLEDSFCEDALKLARELRNTKEGAESFDVVMGLIRAQYCLNDISSTLELSSEARQKLKLTPTQESVLTAFLREKVTSQFAELKFQLPPGKSGQVDIALSRVGDLKVPELEPYYLFVRKRLAEGVEPPVKVYLPFGSYEIDQVERTLETSEGITFTIGNERLSNWKRAQIGDGQAFGVGYLTLNGFTTEPYTVDQPGSDEQLLIGAFRPTFSSTPFFELSSTHSTAVGSVGMMGLRGDLRIRPPAEFLGGTESLEGENLVPSLYTIGASVLLELPQKLGVAFQVGAGIRAGYMSYTRYLAFVDITSSSGTSDSVQVAVNLPSYLAGPEVKASAAKAIRTGNSGIQIGFEVNANLQVLVPASREGMVRLSGSEDLYPFNIGEDTALWGPVVSGTLFMRTPFF